MQIVYSTSKAGNSPNAASRNASMRNSANTALKTEKAMKFVRLRGIKMALAKPKRLAVKKAVSK